MDNSFPCCGSWTRIRLPRMLGLQCQSGPGQRSGVGPWRDLRPFLTFSAESLQDGLIIVGELWGSFIQSQRKRKLFVMKNRSSAAPIRVSKLMCLLPKFLRLSCESTSSLPLQQIHSSWKPSSVYLQANSHDSRPLLQLSSAGLFLSHPSPIFMALSWLLWNSSKWW